MEGTAAAIPTLDSHPCEQPTQPSGVGISWPNQLQRTMGLPGFTGNMEIYFDFDWVQVIGHRHSKFRHCKDLAKHARKDCRDGKRPALLLTIRDGFVAETLASETHRVVAVNFHRLREAQSVTHFFANNTDVPLTDLRAVERQLSDIAAFLTQHPNQRPRVEQIVRQADSRDSNDRASIKDAINILEAMTHISETDAIALLTLLKFRVQDVDVLDGLLDAVLNAEHVVSWTLNNPNRRRELIEKLDASKEIMGSVDGVIDFLNSHQHLRPEEIEQVLGALPRGSDNVLAYLRKNMPLIKWLAENEYTESDLQAVCYRREQLRVFEQLLTDKSFFESKRQKWNARTRESVWQKFFECNHWIFGYGLRYVFMTAVDPGGLEQPTTGTTFDHAGKRLDGLMKTMGELSHVCFVEIKMHDAPLLKPNKTPYRSECWAIGDEVAGGIIQVQQTIAKAVRERSPKVTLTDEQGNPTGATLFWHQPKGFLIVGNQSEFLTVNGPNEHKVGSFELFRRNVTSPEILTYDELLERARYIVEHSESAKSTHQTNIPGESLYASSSFSIQEKTIDETAVSDDGHAAAHIEVGNDSVGR